MRDFPLPRFFSCFHLMRATRSDYNLVMCVSTLSLNPMRTTRQLVKFYTPPYIEPIIEGVRKIKSHV